MRILYWWTLAVVLIPNIWLALADPMPLAGRLADIILPLGVWWLCLSGSRHLGRTVLWMFPLMFFAAFQIVLLYMFGRSVIAVDMFLNLVTTNPTEVNELLGNMLVAVITVAVLYLPPIITAVTACCARWRAPETFIRRFRLPAFAAIIVGVICLVLAYVTGPRYSVLNDLFPINALYNVVLAVQRTIKTAQSPALSASYTFGARIVNPADSIPAPDAVIVVVGETSRAGNWSLNGYHRPTNAALTDAALAPFISYPKALSESNTTHKSVPMLLSHLDSRTFEDSVYSVKSLLTAFAEAGYSTAFFSNQRYNRSFIDRFGFEADTTVFIKEPPLSYDNPTDLAFIPMVARRLADAAQPTLIVLHTYGSHFSYLDRYQGNDPVFTPDRPLTAEPANRPVLLNAYDNSIALTSRLLASLARQLQDSGKSAVIVYTSDHGEDIYDDSRKLFLHASPVPSAQQIHVPFVLWFSPAYAAAHPQAVATAKAHTGRNISSSRSFFHTILDAGHVATAVSDPAASLLSPAYTDPARLYLTDHNEAMPLTEIGMRTPDFNLLDSLGISK